VLGLFLGALGVFAVIAYSVEQRMQEFGIRISVPPPWARPPARKLPQRDVSR